MLSEHEMDVDGISISYAYLTSPGWNIIYNLQMWETCCTIFTYKDEGGSCDSGLWQALTQVIIDIYIYNFHCKSLYICIIVKYIFSDSDFHSVVASDWMFAIPANNNLCHSWGLNIHTLKTSHYVSKLYFLFFNQ